MTQALYRRYRPDTFAEVIGQEHVTEPLVQALRADKVTHAYLFSGPRGCGKTTSARILARCLNCAQGPTPEPCGECDSCVELARGGAGSLDVVEIDAASHGGVDDARDLRERATFAPTRDRYKVFILDEAHMVSSQGFNALLKIVEEPPEHIKFIFATTEPDKVIGTIRSRTHHYPFRLVGPATLLPYLEQICESEDVPVGSGVLPLVVRAGGGSVRDSLSVLDQLVAGADEGGIDYERAVALLGYTHAALLDDAVDAVAARDGVSAFRVVDRVVSSGHEPRRFVEDLLERLRDLIVIAASDESAGAVLRDLPADQLDRMRAQASALGAAELSRSADLANTALTEMTGATSPRLHLELLVARLLLPAADDGTTGLAARLDRVERELGSRAPAGRSGSAPATAAASVPAPPSEPATAPEPATPPAPAAVTSPRPQSPPTRQPLDPPTSPAITQSGDGGEVVDDAKVGGTVDDAEVHDHPRDPVGAQPTEDVRPAATEPVATATEPVAAAGGIEAETVRRRWPEVLDTLRGLRMATWVLVSQNAQVTQATSDKVILGFTTPQLATTFRNGTHAENLQRALHETLGLDARVETGLSTTTEPGSDGPSAGSSGRAVSDRSGDGPATNASPGDRSASGGVPSDGSSTGGSSTRGVDPDSTRRAEASWAAPAGEPEPAGESEPTGGAEPTGEAGPADEAAPAGEAEPADGAVPPGGSEPADGPGPRGESAPAGESGTDRAPAVVGRPSTADDGNDAASDDPDLNASGLVGAPLVARMLGGTVIDEVPDPPA